MAPVSIASVRKSYGSLQVLHGVSAEIKDGEFVILVGPSGCGKSTLLRMIAGLESITGGDVKIDGKVVNALPPKDRDIAMVFQSYALYPHMTVGENMGFSLKLAGKSKPEIESAVRKAADILALTPLLDRLPKQLSGGQRQRVAMGRAIVRQPKVFLFDEPLSNLDAKLRVQMRAEIKELHQRLRTTTIYVTHDQVEAMTMADRIVIMNGGNVEQVGRPLDLYDRPNNLFVAAFIGSPGMNLIEGTIEQADGGNTFVGISGARVACGQVPSAAIGRPIILGCRPEHIHVAEGENGTAGTVIVVEPTGAETHLSLKVNGQDVVVLLRDRIDAGYGDTLNLNFQTEKLHYFDKQTGQRIAA